MSEAACPLLAGKLAMGRMSDAHCSCSLFPEPTKIPFELQACLPEIPVLAGTSRLRAFQFITSFPDLCRPTFYVNLGFLEFP